MTKILLEKLAVVDKIALLVHEQNSGGFIKHEKKNQNERILTGILLHSKNF
jgi:hypothetical protein